MKKLELDAYHIKDIRQFSIYKTRNKNYDRQYIIWNRDFPFANGHTHRFTLGECESIVQNILLGVEPRRKGSWKDFNDLLVSYVRLSDCDVYITHLVNLANNKCMFRMKELRTV